MKHIYRITFAVYVAAEDEDEAKDTNIDLGAADISFKKVQNVPTDWLDFIPPGSDGLTIRKILSLSRMGK